MYGCTRYALPNHPIGGTDARGSLSYDVKRSATQSVMRAKLPFTMQPACEHGAFNGPRSCMATNTQSTMWHSPILQPEKPNVSTAALEHMCGPLRIHTVQGNGTAALLNSRSFWSSWLPWGVKKRYPAEDDSMRRRRCIEDLSSWQPKICELRNVHIAGAAQVLFNSSHYFGPAPRIASTLRPDGVSSVEARVEHVVLTRNEFGAGYYHIMFDTLASLAWVLPKLRDDPSATFLLNPCNLGREQDANAQGQGGGKRGVAPGFGHACNARRYAMELLEALGVAQSRVLRSPYTRQRAGPAIAAGRATFMCAHPFHPKYQRDFWYVRQLRLLLHRAFALSPQELPPAAINYDTTESPPWAGWAGSGYVILITRRGCASEGCDTSRTVRRGAELLAALKTSFPAEKVLAFDGDEPVREQARLFHGSSVVAGPHGAAFANIIYMPVGSSLIEFHRKHPWQPQQQQWQAKDGGGTNSPLYALLCRALQLRHWVVLDTKSQSVQRGYSISQEVLIDTVSAALAAAVGETYHEQEKGPLRGVTTPLLKPGEIAELPSWILTEFG